MESVLKRAVRQFRVVALTGPRQTGKSTLLQHLFARSHRYVSLDDPRELVMAQNDPELFFEQHPPPLIIDEIQQAPGLLPRIKMLVDRRQQKGDFILTGSQRFTLMRGLGETLAGRVGLFELLPLSLSEGTPSSKTYERRGLRGSYPETILSIHSNPHRWYASYVSTYIEKDVLPHYRLEKVAHFRNFILLLAARNAQLLNYQSLAGDLGVSLAAVRYWTSILEASGIIYILRPYYVNLTSRIVKSPKVFFTDLGLVCYLTGQRDRSALTRGPQAGADWESFVIQEVLKLFYNRGVDPRIFFLRTNNGLEVDLLIEIKPGRLIPCEIKRTLTPSAGHASTIARLRDIFGVKAVVEPGFVVCPIKSEPRKLSAQDTACNLEFLLKTVAAKIR